LGSDVGDEIRGDITIVEPRAFGSFDFICHGPFLLHGDHTLLSDLFHSLGNEVSELVVAVGGDGGDLHNFGDGGDGVLVTTRYFVRLSSNVLSKAKILRMR